MHPLVSACLSDVETLLPGLGFFGEGPHLGLDIDIPPAIGSIKAIRLSVDDLQYGYLNLIGLTAFGRDTDQAIDLLQNVERCTQSSYHPSFATHDGSGLLSQRGIHTLRETSQIPWWELTLRTPQAVSRLHLDNRPDGWGCRSRGLCVDVQGLDGLWQRIYHGRSAAQLWHSLSTASRWLQADTRPNTLPITTLASPAQHRTALMTALAQRLRHSVQGDAKDWRTLLAFCPIWSTQPPMSDDELTIVAAMMITSYEVMDQALAVQALSLSLCTGREITRLQTVLNQVSQAQSLGEWVITRHGIQKAVLRSERESFLKCTHEVIDLLTAQGMPTMLAYGTLLGAARDQRFMAHDDDVDLLYLIEAHDHASATQAVSRLSEWLTSLGYKVQSNAPHGLNLHVQPPNTTAWVDVFPCWRQNGRAYLHMERMCIRDIPEEVIWPLSHVQLHGESFAAPARIEDFLIDRYGADWKTPDPFFEWPWPLENPRII